MKQRSATLTHKQSICKCSYLSSHLFVIISLFELLLFVYNVSVTTV